MVEDPSSRVFVVLYDLSEGDEKELDNWDGVSLGYYRRLKVRVETLDGDVLAWLYVLNFWEGGLPSARSIGILADSAERAGAPADYVSALRALPCAKMGDSNTRYGSSWGRPWRLWRWLRRPWYWFRFRFRFRFRFSAMAAMAPVTRAPEAREPGLWIGGRIGSWPEAGLWPWLATSRCAAVTPAPDAPGGS